MTRAVQLTLVSFGYTITVDGEYGPQTTRAVMLWQRANGLHIDGIAGPMTLDSLGLSADATAPAVRVDPPTPEPQLSGCEEMSAVRQAAGLPVIFDAIGYRESNCRNDVTSSTGCCHGWWQNYLSSHLSRQSAYRDRIINECGVTGVSDIKGLSAEQKIRQACVTFVVWSISGMSPWNP